MQAGQSTGSNAMPSRMRTFRPAFSLLPREHLGSTADRWVALMSTRLNQNFSTERVGSLTAWCYWAEVIIQHFTHERLAYLSNRPAESFRRLQSLHDRLKGFRRSKAETTGAR